MNFHQNTREFAWTHSFYWDFSSHLKAILFFLPYLCAVIMSIIFAINIVFPAEREETNCLDLDKKVYQKAERHHDRRLSSFLMMTMRLALNKAQAEYDFRSIWRSHLNIQRWSQINAETLSASGRPVRLMHNRQLCWDMSECMPPIVS